MSRLFPRGILALFKGRYTVKSNNQKPRHNRIGLFRHHIILLNKSLSVRLNSSVTGVAKSFASPTYTIAWGFSVIPKRPAQAGARAIVAAGEARRRAIVPVAIERNVPGEIPPELNVIRCVESEMDAAGLR
jgi:hypothetical protein